MEFRLLDADKQKKAIDLLFEHYPDAKYYLNFKTPVDLMAAAILSAQTRDEVINASTPDLFRDYKTAEDYANASPDELVKYIRRVSFAGAKARNIIKAFRMLVERHGGKVPDKMEDLLELPGIGRKTANTILINAYGIAEGIPVDTWVIKLSGRIGLSENKDPDKIEQDLSRIVEKRRWGKVTYVMKSHGKKICQSQVPICSQCFLNKICPRNNVTKSK